LNENFVTGRNTFADWNHHLSGICILPVGAFEQHSYHLPLATDALLAEYFGEYFARELGAALLPTLNICTSYEHSGFRGSFSLKPETTMAVIRDLAEEAERQNFHTLIIINWHGGNFSLVPVVRDFNRQDRPLKIILCFPPGPGSVSAAELHAGEWETSVMLHLFPERVGAHREDVTNPRWLQGEIERADLNLYGVGYAAPDGALGLPTRASAEKGAQIVAQIQTDALEWLKQRLSWLKENRRFSGAGGITLRPMQPKDFDAAMNLKTSAGWNQTRHDWENFWSLRPDGCFVAVRLGQVIGTVTTIHYQNRFSWIGMVLVSPREQRQGIGSKLMARAMESLAGCETIKLDATPAGKKVYALLGFQDEYCLERMLWPTPQKWATENQFGIRPLLETDLQATSAFDAPIFGAVRTEVLRCWYQSAPQYAFGVFENGQMTGFCLGRAGANFDQIGPIICQTPEQARLLLIAALQLAERPLVLDTGIHSPVWLQILSQLGFERQRQFIRMFKGPNRFPGKISWQWAISGPELG
jgi:creatinine amidohydrolase